MLSYKNNYCGKCGWKLTGSVLEAYWKRTSVGVLEAYCFHIVDIAAGKGTDRSTPLCWGLDDLVIHIQV